MNTLVLDTSTEGACVGVRAGDGDLASAAIDAPRRHGRDLVPRLREALDRAGLRPLDLGVVAVGIGPGSYTGLRIGLAAAKTLAYVAGAAILGVDSLEAVAANAPPEVLRISAIADAQRGNVYAADFSREAAGGPPVRATPTRVETLSDWAARLEPGTFVIGPGVDVPRIRAGIPDSAVVADSALNRPAPAGLLALAERARAEGRSDDLWTLEPLYLRGSAAEQQWDARPASRPIAGEAKSS